MFEVLFYQTKDGREPVKEYTDLLKSKSATDKNLRIKLQKIVEYIQILQTYGTRAGLPYMKHLKERIWELRPVSNRIFFFYHEKDQFVLLHHFEKKTKKTPKREIEQAKRNKEDLLIRSKTWKKN